MNTETKLAITPLPRAVTPLPRDVALPRLAGISKLARAKAIYRQMVASEGMLIKTRDVIFRGAWELGQILNDLKEEIGHGNWLLWLCANFQELGKSDDTRKKNAERCMIFHTRNPNSRNSSNFEAESVRKFMWGYIPTKERVQLEGDKKDAPATHYLTFVNNFSKWDRQVAIGQAQLPPVDVLRRELESPLLRIIELCGKDWVLGLIPLQPQRVS